MKKIVSRTITKNKLFELQLHDVKLSNGKIIKDYFYAKANDGVSIVPITQQGEFIFLEHYRYAANTTILCLPGGLRDNKTEDLTETARRELEEETGYVSNKFNSLGFIYPLPGNITNKTFIYLAINCLPSGKFNPDETEKIKLKKFKINEVFKLIKNNKIKDSVSLASIFMAMDYLKEQNG